MDLSQLKGKSKADKFEYIMHGKLYKCGKEQSGDDTKIYNNIMKRKSNQSVCFSMFDSRNTYWYTFDLSNEGEDDRIIFPCRCNCGCPCAKRIRHDTTPEATPSLSPTKVLPRKDRMDSGWAVVGNQLYRLGGSFREGSIGRSVLTKTVRALDLVTNNGSSSNIGGNNTPGWQRKARMLVARSPSGTVAVGGKIYVLGGNPDLAYKPWAEVYDPTSNVWEALPPPPEIPEPGYEFLSAGLEDDNDREKGSVIVLSVRDALLLQYNVANRSWDMSKLQRWSSWPACRMGDPSGSALAVGRMIYWFSSRCGHLYGVHLDTHSLYASELVVDVPSSWVQRPMLGHLGGQKFFLLHESFYERLKAGFMMHCVKFSVALVDAREEMTISLESSQSFVLKSGLIGNGCVVMSSQSQ